MAYSVLGIVNMALGKIGQPKISSLSEQSTPANQANLAWEYVRDEVLELADWVFAKTRKALARSTTDPVQGFLYAYTLPPDFSHLCRQREDDPPVYPDVDNYPTPVLGYVGGRPLRMRYIVETLADGTLCLFTDYDNSTADLVVQYIRKEGNPARYSALFCTICSIRLAAELAAVLAGVKSGMDVKMWDLFLKYTPRAVALNLSGDYLKNETHNSDDWSRVGR